MRTQLLLASLFAFALLANGQALLPDSLQQRYDSLIKSQLSRADSAGLRINQRIDSIQQRINSAFNPDFGRVTQKLLKKRKPLDSLTAMRELDSLRSGLQLTIDSLAALNLPTHGYTRKLDSLKGLGPMKYIQQVEAKAKEWQGKINRPIDRVEGKINEALGQVHGAGLPSSVNLPGANLNTDLAVTQKLKLTEAGLLPDVDNPLKGNMGESGGVQYKIDQAKGIPREQIGKLKSIDEVKGVQEALGDANQVVDKAQAYQSDIKNIASGDLSQVQELPGALEERAKNLGEIKELEKQIGELSRYQEMIGKGNDPEAMKDLAKEQAVEFATDHFAGQQGALNEAMEKMSKLKSKYASVTSITDLPKRAPNPMKGKPFIERIIPGVTLQVSRDYDVMIDFNPILAWRFSGRVSGGAGWIERVSFSNWNKTVDDDRIYGPRLFCNFMLKNGFSVKAEGERANVLIPPFVYTPDAGRRVWVWSAFVGIKKDYRFIGRVNGNMQILYNLYDDHDQSPYVERLNVRMGIEFPLRLKAGKTSRQSSAIGDQ